MTNFPVCVNDLKLYCLQARILNLEVELEKECAAKRQTEERSPQARREEDEQVR
jgi:hypothetical protein